MKLSKRFLATVLAVVFVLTSFATVPAFAATFTDVTEEHNSYDAVNVLNKLGVINGYDDGTFKPDNNVTRAEFTAMLLRTRGMGSVGSTSLENPPFPDVTTSDVSWAIANIRTAREMGIINGYDDGTFKPNNNVSYEEAVKMIVCALGYGEMGTEGAFWYSRYLMTAQSLGFLTGAGGAVATPATRATIASMLYNCLEVKLAENNAITNNTILEHDLKLTKKVGYISTTPELSLVEPDSNLRDDEITITSTDEFGSTTTTTFQVDDVAKYADMIGEQITYYYTDNREAGTKTLLMADVKNSVELEIEAKLIRSYTNSSIEYLKTADAERTSNAGIAPGSIVVYNGKLYGANAAASSFANYCSEMSGNAMPTIGKVRLLDREGDGTYDVVFVDSYTAWVASSTTPSSYTVVDQILRKNLSTDQNRLILNPEETGVSIKYETVDGGSASFSSIKKGTVICLKESNSNNGGTLLKTVVICNNSVNGTITTTNSKTGVTINGKTYKFSKQAPWESAAVSSGALDEPVRGDGGTFYLDCDGNIIAYDKTEAKVNQIYGYVQEAKLKTTEFDQELQVFIVTSSNTKGKAYNITTKTKMNGSTKDTLGEYKDAIDNKSVIKFASSDGSTIDEFITATEAVVGMEITSDALYKYTGIDTSGTLEYTRNSNELSVDGDKVYVGSATLILDVSNPSKYKVMKTGDFIGGGDYKVDFYDVTTTNSAKVVIVYSGESNVDKLKQSSPVIMISSKEESEDSEGSVVYTLVGNDDVEYVLSTDDTETNTVARNLEEGDIVRLGGNAGEYTLKAENVMFSLSDTPSGIAYDDMKQTNENGSDIFAAIWGSVYMEYDGERLILAEEVLEGWDGTGDKPTVSVSERALKASWFSGAKFYRVSNDSEFEIELDSQNYDEILRGLVNYNDSGDTIVRPTELFIHMSAGDTVKTVFIIER